MAKRAGVSLKTVSNVVNNYEFVRDSTRAKVLAAIDELGYSVNIAAKSLRHGRGDVIGVSLHNLRLPYFAELSSCLAEEALALGKRTVFMPSGFSRCNELGLLHGPFSSLIGGLILDPQYLTEDDESKLLHCGYPVVLIGEDLRLDTIDRVTTDNADGTRQATASLIAAGCRRIAIIGAGGNNVASEPMRLEGYRQALRDAGLPLDPALEIPAAIWYQPAGEQAVREMLRDGVRPDGIVCMNDLLAMGAMQELRRRHLIVPDDVRIVGYDDSIDSRYLAPPLSSVDPDLRTVAREALRLLCARIDGTVPAGADTGAAKGGAAARVVVRPRFVERESSR
ncbi:LacI family DNA-binding transcriptional regulator [Bifidobacterium sp. 82T10]|uniref:LacI family DNA-binding transcriptional regulator n=1 Tax=Bifidobacterium miconis TaxID=2834435 RepID=A0ABS6WGN6_9BIFI|nr:LacI family DNA-binding transcriptional regulator [Bifidobacterium miconis]